MASSWESFGRLARLARKELSEILRDRRTIITLFLMPLLLYPLLSIAFQQLYLVSQPDPTKKVVQRLGFYSQQDETEVLTHLHWGQELLKRQAQARKLPWHPPETRPLKELLSSQEAAQKELAEGKVDVVVRVERRFEPPQGDHWVSLDLSFVPESTASVATLNWIERLLAGLNGAALRKRLQMETKQPISYVHHVRSTVAPAVDSTPPLAALVPLILILMTITGAVYPAIDLTAGERERGTLEVLVAAPVPRLGLLLAKYVTVLTVAMLTALVNLVTMIVTLTFSGLGQVEALQGALTAGTLIQLLFLLLLFALFFSAVLLCLTSFARSFKEAQAYLIPLMLASLGPGLIGLIPGLKLEGFLTVAPLVNIVLLGRDLLQGGAEWLPAILVIVSTVVYALAAIAVAARVFGAESVLYSEQSSWTDLWRRPRAPSAAAAPAAALWSLMLTLPAHFILQGSVGLLGPLPRGWSYALIVAISAVLFLGIPLLFAWAGRVRLLSGFGMAAARPVALAGGMILGLSLWPVVLWLLSLVHSEVPAWLQERLAPLREDRRQLGLVISVVLPALLEELFFRGFLFSALRRVSGAWTTILGTALAFGVLHVVMGGPLGLSRFFPSALMGLILGWVCWMSGSVIPGMILHGLHNALLILAPEYLGMGDQVPWPWLAAGLAGTALGIGLVWNGRRRLVA